MTRDIDNVIDMASAKPVGQLAWIARLARNEQGGALPTVANALIIFANDPALSDLLAFNEFTSQHLIKMAPPSAEESGPRLPGPYPRPWGAEDVSFVQGYFQRVWSGRFARSTVEDAMVAEASIRRFHPICDWLDGLVWDGIPRIDNWLINAFDCDNTPLHKAVGAKFLIAAVRRIKNPGVKFDHMMVLEGSQGLGKSTALKELFGADWFSDSIPPDLTSKDAAMALLGVWCLEFAEIEHLIKSEVETIKAFLSRSVDRYRPPYAKAYVERPRQGVLVGTTNSDDYLRDTSGNRRIWPVACRAADSEWVAVNREQLWAEAVNRESNGEAIWLDDVTLRVQASNAQENRLSVDVWHDTISQWLNGKVEVKVADILQIALGVPMDRMTKGLEMRVANILRGLKWHRRVVRNGISTLRYWVRQSDTTSSDISNVTTSEIDEGEIF
jgi:predicted P-loop ATPase